jgi:hypothetical protein
MAGGVTILDMGPSMAEAGMGDQVQRVGAAQTKDSARREQTVDSGGGQ